MTTHVHTVPRLGVHGAILPLPNASLWRGASLSRGTTLEPYIRRHTRQILIEVIHQILYYETFVE
jgi:hypothetical protein